MAAPAHAAEQSAQETLRTSKTGPIDLGANSSEHDTPSGEERGFAAGDAAMERYDPAMPILFVSGDIFDNAHAAQALAHGCNCQGSMGA
jgi:hypothetical protein